jgi:ferritin-like metal-binding protein YciE
MSKSEEKLIQYLNEAHATELALVSTLRAHISMTPTGSYRALLETHLEVTKRQSERLERRLGELGVGKSLVQTGVGVVQSLVGQVLSLTKGPIDLLRGDAGEEKLLKNAKDECATEALEIATYDAIEAVANALGDTDTAALAASHRADEERMLDDLRALIPQLAGAARSDPFPIANYDELNAGQIIARLSTLSQRDLARALAYERAHRNRRSIVERAEALTAEEPWPGYDDADVPEVLAGLDTSTAAAVREYESRHRRRVAVLEAATNAS